MTKKKKNTGTEKKFEYSNSEIVFEYSERIRIFEYPLTSLVKSKFSYDNAQI